jgi:hypothetical protein
VRLLITLRHDYKLQHLKINIISEHEEYFQDVMNRGNRGRWRPRSPSYCETSVVALNAAEDSIRQLQAALDEEQRTSATLHHERDDAQNSVRIWERDLLVLRGDHCKLQDNFGKLTIRFSDLQLRIQEAHPDFLIWSRRNPQPINN